MDLHRSDDQELFRETTRQFLETTCPVSTVRELAEKEPAGYPSDWWRRGAELGGRRLLVPEDDGGGSISGHGLLGPGAGGRGDGPAGLAGPAPGRPTWWPPPWPTLGPTAGTPRSWPSSCRARRWPRGAWPSPGGWSGDGGRLTAVAGEGGLRARRGEGRRSRRPRSADHLLVAATVDGRPDPVPRAGRAPRGSPSPPLESLDLVRRYGHRHLRRRRRSPTRRWSARSAAAGRDVERQLQIAVVLQCAEMVGAIDQSSSSPSSTRSTATRSAARSPPTRPSSTGSPT